MALLFDSKALSFLPAFFYNSRVWLAWTSRNSVFRIYDNTKSSCSDLFEIIQSFARSTS